MNNIEDLCMCLMHLFYQHVVERVFSRESLSRCNVTWIQNEEIIARVFRYTCNSESTNRAE